MAYDYFISTSGNNDKVKIPQWISERDNRMESYISAGEVDYRGKFTCDELIQLANHYADIWGDTMNSFHADLQNKGLAYIKNADTDQFTLSAIYWSSGDD
ncbi:hypothetical protein [Psychrobacter immobilis]|uniref:hypothetical protein n=2 Tax=Psychrobacter TaxID=497 RepID=UPI003FD13565